MAIVGYARVSSADQSLTVQTDKLNLNGCEKLYQEKHSGTTDDRPQLKACLDYVREGDTLVITKLDRLARSTFHLTQIADRLKEKKVELLVIDQALDTRTSTGRLLFNMLGAIAEFETEIRKERQRDGISKAKEQGVKFGAKPKLTPQSLEQLKEDRVSGLLITDLMTKYRISKTSVYRALAD